MATPQFLIDQLQTQGQRIYTSLQAEIARMESQLEDLQDVVARWRGALSGRRPGRPRGRRASAQAAATKGARKKATRRAKPVRKSPPVDWDVILKKLPPSFTMEHVARKTPKLAKFPRARVMAVARWSRFKKIKKAGDGRYAKE